MSPFGHGDIFVFATTNYIKIGKDNNITLVFTSA